MSYHNYIIPIIFVGAFLLFHERIFSDKSLIDHIKFSYECFDRVITNCISKNLQYEKGLATYLFDNYYCISREVVKARTASIHEQMEQLAKENNLEIININLGNSLLEQANKEWKKRQPVSDDGDYIVAIFKQQNYGNCWNFHSKEKTLRRKVRRVYHYTAYHFDRDFGLGSHTLNTYLPNNVRGYFNQHNWITQQLKHRGLCNNDIEMYYNSFQDIGTIDHEKFQAICDSISYDDVSHYDRKWILALWPELRELHYRSYIDEAEFCSNIVFKQKSFLNNFYNNHMLFTYDISHPDNLSFVFKRRIDRRYKNEFKTKLKIVETKPSLKLKYKSQQYKEYLKNRVLRSESTVNNAPDLNLKKSDFESIRNTCRGINERAISIQQPVDPNWIRQDLDHNPFERVMIGQKWVPGIKINDNKMASVMKGLSKSNVIGITMRELTDFVNQDLGLFQDDCYKLSQISYAVRTLRGHILVEKIKGRILYRFTCAGQSFVRMFLRVTEKIVFPFTKNIIRLSRDPKYFRKEYQPSNTKSDNLSSLNKVYKTIDKGITDLFDLLDVVTLEKVEA